MSYENTIRRHYGLLGLPYSVTNATFIGIRVPPNVRFAAIEDITVSVTTPTVGSATPGLLQVGTPNTSGKFAAQPAGPLTNQAIGAAYGTADSDGRVAAYSPDAPPSAVNKGFIDLLNDGDVPGVLQSVLKIGTVASTGGVPAGVYNGQVTIRFW
jgi:hypothetical protein